MRHKIAIRGIVLMIIATAVSEFLMKVSTSDIPELNATAIMMAVYGLTLIPQLMFPKVQAGIKSESKNFKWAFLTEGLIFAGILTLYIAMDDLPATIVSSVAAIQPLAVLVFERLADKKIGKISKDHLLLPKSGAIALIVLGVAMMYWIGTA